MAFKTICHIMYMTDHLFRCLYCINLLVVKVILACHIIHMKMQHIQRENNNLTILASNPKNNNKSLYVKMNGDTYLVQNIKI